MKYKGNHCAVCDNDDFFALSKGNKVGAYCSNCDRWLKWLSKNDAKCFRAANSIKTVNATVYGCVHKERGV